MLAEETTTDNAQPDDGQRLEDDTAFDELMSNYLEGLGDLKSGQVVDARVVDIKDDFVLLDVGDKAEGLVQTREFMDFKRNLKVQVGDSVQVVVKGRDSETGQILVSYQQAQARQNWQLVVDAHRDGRALPGFITKALKTGVLVDTGFVCFMPASQCGLTHVDKLESLVGQEATVYVIDVDENRKRAVVSRRKVLAEEAAKKRVEVLDQLQPGETVTGKVKNIVEFGVFVDLGGIDGLVPREEIAWEKKFETADLLKPGYNYKFKVLTVDKERGRVSLSRRQLKPDPWEKIAETYAEGSTVEGTVTNTTHIYAYVSLDGAVEGRIHRDNLSWAMSFRKPSDVLKNGDGVKAVVLGYEKDKRLLELGLKQVTDDPWAQIEQKFPIGSRQKVKVLEVVNYGAFVEMDENTKGLIHVTDMTHDRGFKDPKKLVNAGDEIEAVVLKVDTGQRRINLGIKQLEEDPFAAYVKAHPVNSIVTGKVKNIAEFGVFVELAQKVEGLIHKTQWSRERIETIAGVAKPGDEVTAKVIKIEKKEGRIALSRRAQMQDEERKEVEAYTRNTKDVKTSLGSLLKNLDIKVD